VTLDGRVDSLKERSIGIDLLGRDVSYDPSSDAIVRVRANDVRKRLSSYYASTDLTSEIQINLPTGSYIPKFPRGFAADDKPSSAALTTAVAGAPASAEIAPPFSRLALIRPALLALLLCILLIRHRMEDRESYLVFWDHVLAGRNTLQLSIPSQDRVQLASSLYPIVRIAGRYGVDTAIEELPASSEEHERLASVQESFATPPALAEDSRLRWILTMHPGKEGIIDRVVTSQLSVANMSSAALLTILPEDTTILHIQGTDNDAIQHLLYDLTSQKNFPGGVIDQLGNHHVLQVLLQRRWSGPVANAALLRGFISMRTFTADRYAHWRSAAFTSSWLLYAGYYLCRENMSTVLQLPSAHAEQDSLTKLLFTFALAYVFGNIFSGTVADLRGPRHIALIGGILSASATTAMILPHTLHNLLALQLLNGFGQGLGFPALSRLLAVWFTRKERPSVLAWWSASYSLGGGLAAGITLFWCATTHFFFPAGVETLLCLTSIALSFTLSLLLLDYAGRTAKRRSGAADPFLNYADPVPTQAKL
jgi:hypothetical protein